MEGKGNGREASLELFRLLYLIQAHRGMWEICLTDMLNLRLAGSRRWPWVLYFYNFLTEYLRAGTVSFIFELSVPNTELYVGHTGDQINAE